VGKGNQISVVMMKGQCDKESAQEAVLYCAGQVDCERPLKSGGRFAARHPDWSSIARG